MVGFGYGFGLHRRASTSSQTIGLTAATFAAYNSGSVPEAFSTAPNKYFMAIKSPPRIAPIEPSVSLDWRGEMIFKPFSLGDSDRSTGTYKPDDDLDYKIYGKHPTDATRHGVVGGTPYSSWTKLKGGRRVRFGNFDTMGWPLTITAGTGGTNAEQMDIRMVGIRGDFSTTPDGDFLLCNGSASGPKARVFRAYMSSRGQKGNNRDPYRKTNTPSGSKLAAPTATCAKDANGVTFVTLATPVTGTATGGSTTTIVLAAAASAVDNAYNGYGVQITGGTGSGQSSVITGYVGATRTATIETVTTAPDATSVYSVGVFADKLTSAGAAFAPARRPLHDDYFLIEGTTFGGQNNLLRDFNWKYNIITYRTFSAGGTVTPTGNAASPVYTLGGTWAVGDTLNLFVAGTQFSYTVVSGQTSASAVATGAAALIAADGRFTGTAAVGAVITVVSTVVFQTVFATLLETGHNVPGGVQSATGGLAYWFSPDAGTHADGSQYSSGGFSFVGEDRCTYKGNYDGIIAFSSAATDGDGTFTRINWEWNQTAPNDVGSGSFRMGYTGGGAGTTKQLWEVYSQNRSYENTASGFHMSAVGGEGTLTTIDGIEGAYTPTRTELKGGLKKGPPAGGDWAPYASCGVDFVDPGESNVDPLAGTITNITFTGLASVNESMVAGATIGLFDVVTTNNGGDIDLSIIATNIPTRSLWLHGRRLVRGPTQIDYETTPANTITITVRAQIRGTSTLFDKVFNFPVNNDVTASGLTPAIAYGATVNDAAPTATASQYPSASTMAIGAATSGRTVICAMAEWAGSTTPARVPTSISMVSTTGGTQGMTQLIQKVGNLVNSAFASAGLWLVDASANATDTAARFDVTSSGAPTAGAVSTFSLTGVANMPWSHGWGVNDAVGGQAVGVIDVPASGKAVLHCSYATPTGNNKRTSGAILQGVSAGQYYFRATVAAGSVGPVTWEYATDAGFTSPIALTASYDVQAEAGGGGSTVVVAASFGAAT
jgi:hypothetical protein